MPRVAIIIPAYNAAATLHETLASALAQTFTDFEVIVVSDGSIDGTAELVIDAAGRDPRIRLIEQGNAGVAAARNAAIEDSDSAFIAPLDADDLWHPQKLALQVGRFDAASARTGLVYNWYHPIDGSGRIIQPVATPEAEGFVLHRHLVWNFVGNGSTPLIRRTSLADLRYEPELAARGAGGCEDYLLQLQLARTSEFACMPAHLTGYRQGDGRMSGNRLAMLRSHLETFNRMRGTVGDAAQALCDRGWAETKVLEASHRAGRKQYLAAIGAYLSGAMNSLSKTAGTTRRQARILNLAHNRAAEGRDMRPRLPFANIDPFARALPWRPTEEFARAAVLDARYD